MHLKLDLNFKYDIFQLTNICTINFTFNDFGFKQQQNIFAYKINDDRPKNSFICL